MGIESPHHHKPLRTIILGGGTAGWMTAAALSRILPGVTNVTLVESEDIGIVGVGEATIPSIRAFIKKLELDESDVLRATHATIKLGIDFRDFGKIGDSYIHPFGSYGSPLAGVAFHHYWLRARAEGAKDGIADYSLAVAMAKACRFSLPAEDTDTLAGSYGHAYQFDATLFAPYLRAYAEKRGVTRIEGKMTAAHQHPDTGNITALQLADGRLIEGDLFIDCSGFASVLIGKTLEEPKEDWSHWLPCDRAIAVPCTSPPGAIEPYTRAIAMPAGWRWRIPLQHRVGNGYVYSSSQLSDEGAADAILSSLEGQPMADPRILRFNAGRRKRSWVKNVVSIGLASGFLEPLESTSIYLAQAAITSLIELFPVAGRIDNADRDEFNRLVDMEYDRIRDFLILHYPATSRDDSSFWNHVRTMEVPDSLKEKINLWTHSATIEKYEQGLFAEPSWIAVLLGQGIIPKQWDQRANLPSAEKLAGALATLRHDIKQLVRGMPSHDDVIRNMDAAITAETTI